MKKDSSKILQHTAHVAHFKTNDKTLKSIMVEYDEIFNNLENMADDISDFPRKQELLAHEINFDDLREDEIDESNLLKKEQVFENAYDHENGFLVHPKGQNDEE
ncbi:hypothetical protein ACA758_03690 [Mycoplasmopsis agassizii]|uniref:hypothetical protein n=1 Tax=Mycoplasmopsis agassizii TaxID=33922 RepID=UPI00352766CC